MGIAAHKSGNLQEADKMYTAVLKKYPTHGDANHNLGIIAREVGNTTLAIKFFKQAARAKPEEIQYWLSLVDTLLADKNFTEATDTLKLALEHNHDANYFSRYREIILDAGTQQFEQVDQKHQNTCFDLHLTQLYSSKDYVGVIRETDTNEGYDTHTAFQFNIRGAAFQSLENYPEAIKCFIKAIELKPEYHEALNNLGVAFRKNGNVKDAIKSYLRAIELNKNYVEAYRNLGVALIDDDNIEGAITYYKMAIDLNPSDSGTWNNLGNAYYLLFKFSEAENCFNNAIKYNCNFSKAYLNLGNLKNDVGNSADAVQLFQKTLEIDPFNVQAHHSLNSLLNYKNGSEHLLSMEELIQTKKLPLREEAQIKFCIAKAYHDLGDTTNSFEYYKQGNAMRTQSLSYNFSQDSEIFRRLKKAQTSLPTIGIPNISNNHTPKPIFILGMPRSGTTLVEQILTCHSQVSAGGELTYLRDIANALLEDASNVNPASLLQLRNDYFERISSISSDKMYVTDKLPHNFLYIPTIVTAFPEAKIIHVKRSAEATCWSNFTQFFASEGLGYSYDLENTVSYYNMYVDLMDEYSERYCDRIIQYDYDTLTNDYQTEIPLLLDMIGIEWEPECLFPHKNVRSVRTASQQQVRKKIYQNSSKNWLKYKDLLAPHFKNLRSFSKLV